MATHKSAEKRHRQSLVERTKNRWWKSRAQTSAKAVVDACEKKDKESAQIALKKAVSEIDKAQSKGALHANTASRKVARLSKKVSSL